MTDRITTGDLETRIGFINEILGELGVEIDGGLSVGNGGASFVGFKGTTPFNEGRPSKRELFKQLVTVEKVLVEVSRQIRKTHINLEEVHDNWERGFESSLFTFHDIKICPVCIWKKEQVANQTADQKNPPFCVECYRTMSIWSDLFPESPANWSVEAQNNARSTYVCANDVCEAYLAVGLSFNES